MEKRDNTAKDLMTITYMIFYIAAAVTAITGGEGTAAYLALGSAFLGFAECMNVKPAQKEKKKLRANRK